MTNLKLAAGAASPVTIQVVAGGRLFIANENEQEAGVTTFQP